MFPHCERFADFLALPCWTQLPNQGTILGKERKKLLVIQSAGEGNAMIPLGPLHVVDMPPDQVRRNPAQPFDVVEETQIVFQLDVPEVMPVADPRMLGDLLLKEDHYPHGGHSLEA